MIYDIRHITRFDYGGQVKFARCNLRLKPIDWPGQRLESYDLSVEPAGRLSPGRAEAGLANVTRLVVDSPVTTLTIESRARIIVDRLVPVPQPDDPTLAEVAALARDSRDLSPAGPATYLFPSPLIPLDRQIADWCAADLDPARGALEAGIALARRIQREFEFDATATLVDTTPHEAFLKRRGVCQDFAQIMISGLRAAGLPAAYASGYIRTIPPPGEARLVGADATHAWVLLWCGPAHGWVGVDPTNGIWMAGDHVVMAVGRDYAEIAPVDGVVLGSGAQAMTVSVDVAPVEEPINA
jgi:transglutaminase-like putative cysteine protease